MTIGDTMDAERERATEAKIVAEAEKRKPTEIRLHYSMEQELRSVVRDEVDRLLLPVKDAIQGVHNAATRIEGAVQCNGVDIRRLEASAKPAGSREKLGELAVILENATDHLVEMEGTTTRESRREDALNLVELVRESLSRMAAGEKPERSAASKALDAGLRKAWMQHKEAQRERISTGPTFKNITGGTFDVYSGEHFIGRVEVKGVPKSWRIPDSVLNRMKAGSTWFHGAGLKADFVQEQIAKDWKSDCATEVQREPTVAGPADKPLAVKLIGRALAEDKLLRNDRNLIPLEEMAVFLHREYIPDARSMLESVRLLVRHMKNSPEVKVRYIERGYAPDNEFVAGYAFPRRDHVEAQCP